MVGHLRPDRLNLTVLEHREYFASYCSLCQHLKANYGTVARLVTSHDALLVQLVVEGLQRETPRTELIRCPVNPYRHPATANGVAVSFAAAISILLIWGRLSDWVADARGPLGFVKRALGRFSLWALRGKFAKARGVLRSLGFMPDVVDQEFRRQQCVEAAGEATLDAAAGPTGRGLGAVFAHTALLSGCPNEQESLRAFGESLGRVIYAIDARADLASDRRTGAFNALAGCAIGAAGASEAGGPELQEFLARESSRLDGSLASLPLQRHNRIIRNIVVDGIRAQVAPGTGGRAEVGLSERPGFLRASLAGGCCGTDCNPCESVHQACCQTSCCDKSGCPKCW